MQKILAVLCAATLLFVAASPGAASATGGEERLQATPGSDASTLRVAANKVYKFVSPFPFAVHIKIYGKGAGFPKVTKVPAPPAPAVPVPYPNKSMKIRIKKPGGGWSKKFTIKWKSGNIGLPAF
jgi:hypothetical protein